MRMRSFNMHQYEFQKKEQKRKEERHYPKKTCLRLSIMEVISQVEEDQ